MQDLRANSSQIGCPELRRHALPGVPSRDPRATRRAETARPTPAARGGRARVLPYPATPGFAQGGGRLAFAILAILAIANFATAKTPASDGPEAAAPVKPVAAVASSVVLRDPFFWPATTGSESGGDGKALPPSPSGILTLADLAARLHFEGMVGTETESRTVIVNGEVYRPGAEIKLPIGNKTYVLKVVGIHLNPPEVVLGYQGEEKTLAISPKSEKGE